MPPRIMWIENKSAGDGLAGSARIGLVHFSKTGRTLNYRGCSFRSLKGSGFKANYIDVESGEEYWISACRRDGRDALYNSDVVIDDDVRVEYWTQIRHQPDSSAVSSFRALGTCK